jgi:Histone RNA hairpin-binding protein RNA-binding domain
VPAALAAKQRETDPNRLRARQRQINIGKNTPVYERYAAAVPRARRRSKFVHPQTPDVEQVCSKRMFDGQVGAWRRALHAWDTREAEKGGQKPRPSGETAEPVESAGNDEEEILDLEGDEDEFLLPSSEDEEEGNDESTFTPARVFGD